MISIIKYTPVNKGFLLGYLDIHVDAWNLEIRGLSVWTKEGRRWFNMPSKEYTKEDGSTGYSDVLKFTCTEWHNNFMKSLSHAFNEYCKEHGS